MSLGGFRCAGIAALLTASAVLFLAAPAFADDLHVTQSTDTGDGVCDSTCTLRDAVMDADTEDDVVLIDPGVSPTLTQAGGGQITIGTNGLTIRGRGAMRTTIRAQASESQAFRVFTVFGSDVTIEDVKITGGVAPNGPSNGEPGGGIQTLGAGLELNRVWVDGNGAVTTPGTFGGNGGGIAAFADTVIRDSTISGNTAGDGAAAGGSGGGIYVDFSADLKIVNSTVWGNAAGSGAVAGGSGGGIQFTGGSGELVSVTVAGNHDVAAGGGGGLTLSLAAVAMRNSVLQNASTTAGAENCTGTAAPVDEGGNIAFPLGGCPAGFATGDLKLDPDGIFPNGGPTPTIALLPGSAAIDIAAPLGGACLGLGALAPLATDQRGQPRLSGAGCDSGAFELQQPPVPPGGGGAVSPPAASPGAGKKSKKKKKRKCKGSFKPKKKKGQKPKLQCVKVSRS